MKTDQILMICSIIATVSFVLGFLVANKMNNCWLVSKGLAEYYLDKNNKRRWRLKQSIIYFMGEKLI